MRIFKIKSRLEFVDIQNNCSRSLATNKIILLYKKIEDVEINKSKIKNFSKFGVCVTKKIDKRAVVRNRIKRLLREGFRIVSSSDDYILNNYKYEIIAKKCIVNFNFNYIREDISSLVKQLYDIKTKVVQ